MTWQEERGDTLDSDQVTLWKVVSELNREPAPEWIRGSSPEKDLRRKQDWRTEPGEDHRGAVSEGRKDVKGERRKEGFFGGLLFWV